MRNDDDVDDEDLPELAVVMAATVVGNRERRKKRNRVLWRIGIFVSPLLLSLFLYF